MSLKKFKEPISKIPAVFPWIIVFTSIIGLICFEDRLDPYYHTILILAGINVIMTLSLNLIMGISGQFSLGHAGFMSVGAYSGAVLSGFFLQTSLPLGIQFFITLLGAGLASAMTGFLVGLPCLRLRGDYLAIVTLGFGEMIRVCLLNMDSLGGARGWPGIPKYTQLLWVLPCCVSAYFLFTSIQKRSLGRTLMAIRDDEIAAQSVGVDLVKYKLIAFVISSFFAGLGGCLFAHHLTYINPATFDFTKSFEFVIMAVLGGLGSLPGSVLAAVLLTCLKELLRPLQQWTHVDLRMILFSSLLIAMMLWRPGGLLMSRNASKGTRHA